MPRPMNRVLTLGALALTVAFGAIGVANASAAPGLTLKGISPENGPEFSSIPIKIHGTGFSTEAGVTKVLFKNSETTTEAAEVVCMNTKECTAMTPELNKGVAEVTVEVEGHTSGYETFVYQAYAPPVVHIQTTLKKGIPLAGFSVKMLTDNYPAIFTPGNVYLQIENRTLMSQTFTSPSGTVTLEPGEVYGLNFPVEESNPRVFELEAAAPNKGMLTVKSKTPA